MSAWGVAALAGIQVPEHWTLALSFLKVECWTLASLKGKFSFWKLSVDHCEFSGWNMERTWGGGELETKRQRILEKRRKGSNCGGAVQEVKISRDQKFWGWWRCQTLNHEDDLKIFLQGRVDGLLDDKYRALSSKEQGAAETHSCHFQLDRHMFFSHRHQQCQLFIHRSWSTKKFLSRWNEACQRMLRWNPVGTEWSIGWLRRGLKKPSINFKHCWLLYFLLLSVFSIAFINTSRLVAQVLMIVSMHSSTDVCKALKALLWTSYDHSLASFMCDTYSRVPSVCQPTKPPWPKIQPC